MLAEKEAMFYFDKVPFEQFKADAAHIIRNESFLREAYNAIRLPEAKTTLSAGFDFHSPFSLQLYPNAKIRIPTGICWKPSEGYDESEFGKYHLSLYPRSGLGCKYMLQLSNTVGIVDADYYRAKNHGHILIDFYRPQLPHVDYGWSATSDTTFTIEVYEISYQIPEDGNDPLCIAQGEAFAQGIITKHLGLEPFTRKEERNGGFGSTTR